jgi:hypothetical protein
MKKPPRDKLKVSEVRLNGNELASYFVSRLSDILVVIRLNGGKINQYYYAYTINYNDLITHSGITDLLLMCPNGDTLWVEIKGVGDTMSNEQSEFKQLCARFAHIHQIATNDNYVELCKQIRVIYEPKS